LQAAASVRVSRCKAFLEQRLCIHSCSAVLRNQKLFIDFKSKNLSRLRHFWQSVCGVAFDDPADDGPRKRLIIETAVPSLTFKVSKTQVNQAARLSEADVSFS